MSALRQKRTEGSDRHERPEGATGEDRFFKQKDSVENYLAAQIRAGKMKKKDVQIGIAKDWTQYFELSKAYYKKHKRRNDGG